MNPFPFVNRADFHNHICVLLVIWYFLAKRTPGGGDTTDIRSTKQLSLKQRPPNKQMNTMTEITVKLKITNL